MANSSLPKIGIIGAGTMGSGIALVALYAGAQVVLQDTAQPVLDKAADYIKKFLEKKGQGDRFDNVKFTQQLEELSDAGVVIEAAPEQLELKRELFRKLEAVCAPDAILATNTSTLSVTAVAAATQQPGRVAGMHFFNPAPLLPLVEVVRAEQSSAETVRALVDLAQVLGKTPVVTGDTPGFIVNRVARPFYGEALRLLGEGVASFESIDAIVERGGGFKMGPFKLMDLIGIDINAGAMRSMYEQTFGEPRYRPHWIQMQKLAAGTLGRKTGRGFYEYKDEGKGMKDEETKVPTADGVGEVVVSEGSWAPHLAEMAQAAGFAVRTAASGPAPAAAFVAAGFDENAANIVAAYDAALPPSVPLLVQGADVTLSEAATWVQHPQRLFAFDGWFAGNGDIVTVAAHSAAAALRPQVERAFAAMGREVAWVGESPALVLPRILAQLVNEAAFAVLEGVGDAATIDLAMKLGVNYPRGLLEWGAAIGYGKVVGVLDHLYAEYHEERYRACVLLRKRARTPLTR
jgi:3-hydroxybutyryl-CoA dehydrogenase